MQKLASTGSVEHKVVLARMYVEGLGVTADSELAQSLLREAAGLGSSEAHFQLAGIYGRAGHKQRAIEELRHAALAGHLPASYRYGFSLLKHASTQEERLEGMRWLELAANRGHVKAKREFERVRICQGESFSMRCRAIAAFFRTFGDAFHLIMTDVHSDRLR
jgi:TPR repeat protein